MKTSQIYSLPSFLYKAVCDHAQQAIQSTTWKDRAVHVMMAGYYSLPFIAVVGVLAGLVVKVVRKQLTKAPVPVLLNQTAEQFLKEQNLKLESDLRNKVDQILKEEEEQTSTFPFSRLVEEVSRLIEEDKAISHLIEKDKAKNWTEDRTSEAWKKRGGLVQKIIWSEGHPLGSLFAIVENRHRRYEEDKSPWKDKLDRSWKDKLDRLNGLYDQISREESISGEEIYDIYQEIKQEMQEIKREIQEIKREIQEIKREMQELLMIEEAEKLRNTVTSLLKEIEKRIGATKPEEDEKGIKELTINTITNINKQKNIPEALKNAGTNVWVSAWGELSKIQNQLAQMKIYNTTLEEANRSFKKVLDDIKEAEQKVIDRFIAQLDTEFNNNKILANHSSNYDLDKIRLKQFELAFLVLQKQFNSAEQNISSDETMKNIFYECIRVNEIIYNAYRGYLANLHHKLRYANTSPEQLKHKVNLSEDPKVVEKSKLAKWFDENFTKLLYKRNLQPDLIAHNFLILDQKIQDCQKKRWFF